MSNELKYPISKVKEVIHKWLYFEDDEMVDVMIAAHLANQFNTDPLWLIFIAPPSSTKTELLRSFDGHKKAHFLSSLTAATLVSGLLSKKNMPEPSLLLSLNGKTLILKDFTSVLSLRSETQQEVLGQLREIYDGQYSKDFGNGKRIKWQGKIGLLGACTPIYDSHYGVIGTLGDRFLLYRSHTANETKMGLQAQKILGQEDDMRKQIREAVHRFINQFDKIHDLQFKNDNKINEMIVTLATFCAYARCPVGRDSRSEQVLYAPMPEGPARLVKQFMQLGWGLAVVHGKRVIDEQVYQIVKKIGNDLVSTQRIKILQDFWKDRVFEYLQGWKKTKEIAVAVDIPTITTKRLLEDLMMVGMLNRKVEGDSDTAAYHWQLNHKAFDLAANSEIFGVLE
jgi:hypothetical protein